MRRQRRRRKLRFRARKTVNLGILRLHFTQSGFSSYSIVLGRYRWNSARGHSLDTPGPGGLRW